MAAGDIKRVRAPWGPGQVIEYVDTGTVYQSAPVYQIVVSTDNVASLGLLGVEYSLGYRVAEIERHIHSYERWFGDGGQTLTAFVIDSGNNDWGAWVEILQTTDTPVIAGSVYYDLHELMITATERTTVYRIQIAFGSDADAAVLAGDYTEIMFISASNLVDAGPVVIQGRRQPVGTQAWIRCWNASDTGTINLFAGLHEYEG